MVHVPLFGADDTGALDNRGVLLSPVHPTMSLSPPSPGVAGRVNEITVTGAPPGAHVHFVYGARGGGEFIPGCDLIDNALQIESPKLAGSAIADANGDAVLRAYVPPAARNLGEILIQAVVRDECAISQLVVHRFD